MPATRDDPAAPPTRPAQTARVAIAEDSLLVREGLGRILCDSGFDVVGTAAKVEELLELVERARPDVALVDIRLPPGYSDEGLRAAAEIRTRFPAVALLVSRSTSRPSTRCACSREASGASVTCSRTASSTRLS